MSNVRNHHQFNDCHISAHHHQSRYDKWRLFSVQNWFNYIRRHDLISVSYFAQKLTVPGQSVPLGKGVNAIEFKYLLSHQLAQCNHSRFSAIVPIVIPFMVTAISIPFRMCFAIARKRDYTKSRVGPGCMTFSVSKPEHITSPNKLSGLLICMCARIRSSTGCDFAACNIDAVRLHVSSSVSKSHKNSLRN